MSTGLYPRHAAAQMTRFSLPYKLQETSVKHYGVDMQYLKDGSEFSCACHQCDHLRHPLLGDPDAMRAGRRDPRRALRTKKNQSATDEASVAQEHTV